MRHLLESDMPTFVREVLFNPSRQRPVVAVTSRPHSEEGWIDPEALQRELGDLAEVVFLVTGDATWALSEAMPPLLDVYGGAVRIWWPGLAPNADPYDHRLFLIVNSLQADRCWQQVLAAVRGSSAPATETATVVAVTPERIELQTERGRGLLRNADLPRALLAPCLQPGVQLPVRPLPPLEDGTLAFTAAGLLPNPWQRFASVAKVGDAFTCRVQNLDKRGRLVFVDVLPGVVGICGIDEIDYSLVEDMAEFVRPGELLTFQVLAIDATKKHIDLSRKLALRQKPQPLPSLVEGGLPFEWRAGMPMIENLRRVAPGERPRVLAASAPTPAPAIDLSAERLEAQTEELKAAHAERADLVAQIRELRLQAQTMKQKLRAAEDREEAQQKRLQGEDDPLSSERAFLLAVRVCYARKFDEDGRRQQPLQRMRLHAAFLPSVRELDGIDLDKVVEVCMQVACDLAPAIAGREVHALRAGPRGAGPTTRKGDGAKAWRCALQVNTPSARRLHWWNVPGPDGATIEFACVGRHDDLDIPE